MTKKILLLFGLLLSGCITSVAENIDSPVKRKYKFSDNTFIGMHVGFNYSMSEYVRNEKFGDVILPQFDFYYGKHICSWFTARVGLGLMWQKASVPEEMKELLPYVYGPYKFNMASLRLDGMICLNRLFHRNFYNDRFQLWGVGGYGVGLTFGFEGKTKDWISYPIDRTTRAYGKWNAGAEMQFRVYENCNILLQWLWHQTGSGYNGQPLQSKNSRNYMTIEVGVHYNFNNQYNEVGFSNCEPYEQRYIDVMNERLVKLNEQTQNQGDAEKDTVILFPKDVSKISAIQKQKVQKIADYLAANQDAKVVVDVYSNGDEEGDGNKHRAHRRANALKQALWECNPTVTERMEIVEHEQASGLPNQHIWSLCAIVTKQ